MFTSGYATVTVTNTVSDTFSVFDLEPLEPGITTIMTWTETVTFGIKEMQWPGD